MFLVIDENMRLCLCFHSILKIKRCQQDFLKTSVWPKFCIIASHNIENYYVFIVGHSGYELDMKMASEIEELDLIVG